MEPFKALLDLIAELDHRRFTHRISSIRAESILIEVAVPGERWEIEIMRDGHFEVEVFVSSGNIRDRTAVLELFERFGD